MATTTPNFGWDIPQSTDLVKDGATAIAALGTDIDTSLVDLKGGTTGQILSKNSNTDMDFTWITNDVGDITAVTAGTGITGGGTSGAVTITNDMATTITASGDIIVGTGSATYDNLPIGTTGQVLTADTTVSPYKVKWADAAATKAWNAVQTSAIAYSTMTSACDYLNGTWIVGGSGGALATSTDGATWTARTSGTTSEIYSFAYGGGVYVLSAASTIRSATDPTGTWTARTDNISQKIQNIIHDGTKFIAVGGNPGSTTSDNKISTSTDGTTWTARLTGTYPYMDVAYDGVGNYVAVGSSGVGQDDGARATSTNGTSWTETTTSGSGPFTGVVWDGTNFVIVGVDTGDEWIKVYTLTTAGVLTQVSLIESINWTTNAQSLYPRILWDGTYYWITAGTGIYRGGANHRFQKYERGYEMNDGVPNPLPFLGYNAGQYIGVGAQGTIMFGTEPHL